MKILNGRKKVFTTKVVKVIFTIYNKSRGDICLYFVIWGFGFYTPPLYSFIIIIKKEVRIAA